MSARFYGPSWYVTETRIPAWTVCAYCGEKAVYTVRTEHGAGFCCEEPAHWTWLVESALAVEQELRREEQ